MNAIKKVLIGADPEVFLYDEEYDEYIPAIDLVGGSKANPKSIGRDHFVQEDNVMAEFNIPPCGNENDFVECIQYALGKIDEIIPNPLQTVAIPSATFKPDYLSDPQACISGCDPYQNAWKDGEIEEAISLADTDMRYAGAHIHIGYNNPTEETSMKIVRALDLFLGVPSIILDDDKKRRDTYGKAGAFREKSYGVEYRSLSNFWLKNDVLMRWVYKNTLNAIDFVNLGKEPPTTVEKIINNSDKAAAEKLIKEYEIQIHSV